MVRKYVDEASEDWGDDSEFDDYDSADDDSDMDDCPYCGREIYAGAYRCPHCENYISKEDHLPARKPMWVIVTAMFLLSGFVAFALRVFR